MGKRGPPPLPTALKIERGTNRPDRTNPDEPDPDGPPEMPAYLEKRNPVTKRAREIWDWRVAELEPLGLVCRRESELFAMYCMELATYEDFQRMALRSNLELSTRATWRRMASAAVDNASKLGAKFGLTASDRTQVKAKKPQSKDDPKRRFFGAQHKDSA